MQSCYNNRQWRHGNAQSGTADTLGTRMLASSSQGPRQGVPWGGAPLQEAQQDWALGEGSWSGLGRPVGRPSHPEQRPRSQRASTGLPTMPAVHSRVERTGCHGERRHITGTRGARQAVRTSGARAHSLTHTRTSFQLHVCGRPVSQLWEPLLPI